MKRWSGGEGWNVQRGGGWDNYEEIKIIFKLPVLFNHNFCNIDMNVTKWKLSHKLTKFIMHNYSRESIFCPFLWFGLP